MRRIWLLAIGYWLLVIPSSLAQSEATAVQFLGVEIWPDYDQPAVLVLLTGTLAPTTALPATVSVPMPASAQLNAVARITGAGVMIDDIEFGQDSDSVTFITPDSQFRVEYYVPYATEGNGRSYTFRWQSPLDVEQMTVNVQQPAAAASLETRPAAVNVDNGRSDGLVYHNLATVAVAPKELYEVGIHYEIVEPRLSVEGIGVQAVDGGMETAVSSQTASATLNAYFILAIASAIFVIGYISWHLVQQQQKRSRKPKPAKTQTKNAKFCHQCGQPAAKIDKFCRHCGQQLKK